MLPKKVSGRGWNRGGVYDRSAIDKTSMFCRWAGGGVTVRGGTRITVFPNKCSKVFSSRCIGAGFGGRAQYGRGGPNRLRFVSSKPEVCRGNRSGMGVAGPNNLRWESMKSSGRGGRRSGTGF